MFSVEVEWHWEGGGGSLAPPTSSKFPWRGYSHSPFLGLRSIVSVVCSFVKSEGWSPIRWDLVRAARWPLKGGGKARLRWNKHIQFHYRLWLYKSSKKIRLIMCIYPNRWWESNLRNWTKLFSNLITLLSARLDKKLHARRCNKLQYHQYTNFKITIVTLRDLVDLWSPSESPSKACWVCYDDQINPANIDELVPTVRASDDYRMMWTVVVENVLLPCQKGGRPRADHSCWFLLCFKENSI